MIEQAVIIAGGKGTRLREVLGEKTPKCLIEINGKPLLLHQIEQCEKAGINEIVILAGHLSEEIKLYVKKIRKSKLKIDIIDDKGRSGTGSSLLAALPFLKDTYFVVYGDIYFQVDLNKFSRAHFENGADISILSHPNNHPNDSDIIEINNDGFVTRFFRPKSEYYDNRVNAAIYICKNSTFESLTLKNEQDLVKDIFNQLLKNGKKIFAYDSIEYAKDIGTPERYHSALHDIEKDLPSKRASRHSKKCVFLDRDGVINKHVGFVRSPVDFELIPGITEVIKTCNRLGHLCIVVTNQSVIARGEATVSQLNLIHRKMQTLLGNHECYVDDIFYCPHHPDSGFEGEVPSLKVDCECRKPNAGMLLKAIKKYNIDPAKSILIGDTLRDLQAAKAANVTAVHFNDNGHGASFGDLNAKEIRHLNEALSIIEGL